MHAQYNTGRDVIYDPKIMREVLDNYVRFLIGDPVIALRNLNEIKNPGVVIDLTAHEYNALYRAFFDRLVQWTQKMLGDGTGPEPKKTGKK